ncbi:MAG: hypothetical protein L6Q95_00200 [Planctomycetes bacterium]|nr:hypothetical protein [Planctomycetota bacterium]
MGFATTRWSVVRAAGGGSTPEARAALGTLCAAYWYPLYAFARRTGRDAHEAEDSVQGFLANLIERNTLAVADPGRGRFRDFLLAAFRNHLRNEAESASAIKRGGGRLTLSLDAGAAEGRFLAEPRHDATPDRLYDRDWAIAVLERVLAGLRQSYVSAGKEPLFDALKETIAGGERALHASRAEVLGMTPGALKVAAHRLRQRYKRALRNEIAATLAEGEDVDDEIRALFATLAPV